MNIPLLPPNIKLIAASKKQSPLNILEAISYGIQEFGENYVQEAEEKQKIIGHIVKWHLIGHLQSNKVKKAVQIFDVIQTVDSIKLASLIDKEAKEINKIMPIMIEVNIADESTKTGIKKHKVFAFIDELKKFNNLKILGLMTMCHEEYFPEMHELFKQTNLSYLSMGMSSDYKEAILNGSNMVRLGTVLFGERK